MHNDLQRINLISFIPPSRKAFYWMENLAKNYLTPLCGTFRLCSASFSASPRKFSLQQMIHSTPQNGIFVNFNSIKTCKTSAKLDLDSYPSFFMVGKISNLKVLINVSNCKSTYVEDTQAHSKPCPTHKMKL